MSEAHVIEGAYSEAYTLQLEGVYAEDRDVYRIDEPSPAWFLLFFLLVMVGAIRWQAYLDGRKDG